MAIIQQEINFLPHDITQNRHGGNEASRDAFKRGDKAGDELAVLLIFRAAGWKGMTSKEIAAAMNKPLNAVSGRCSALKAKGLIYGTGQRKDGAEILRAK